MAGGRGPFPSTQNSALLGALSEDEALRRRSWERLARAYHRPIYKHVRLLKEDGKPMLTTSDTTVSGDYKIQPVGREADDAPRFAVNPELRESDSLDLATNDEGKGKLGVELKSVASADPDSLVNRPDKEWPTVVLLLLLAAFVCGEAAWAWHCGRTA